MENTFWHKQTVGSPLYPDLVWSRPQTKAAGGRLLVLGGNAHGFSSVALAYSEALKAGAGVIKITMPDAIKSAVKNFLPECEFVPSTPSGSFARASIAELNDLGDWATGVLLAGEFGRNSETAIVLETFLDKVNKPIVLTGDSIDYFYTNTRALLKERICLVATQPQLQKIVTGTGFSEPITHNMDLIRLVETLHQLTQKHPWHLVVTSGEQIIVASNGKVSTTKSQTSRGLEPAKIAAYTSVWWLQNSSKPFEALTTAVYEINS